MEPKLVKFNITLPETTKEMLWELAGGKRKLSGVVDKLIIKEYNLQHDGSLGAKKVLLELQYAILTLAHNRTIRVVHYAHLMRVIGEIERDLQEEEKELSTLPKSTKKK